MQSSEELAERATLRMIDRDRQVTITPLVVKVVVHPDNIDIFRPPSKLGLPAPRKKVERFELKEGIAAGRDLRDDIKSGVLTWAQSYSGQPFARIGYYADLDERCGRFRLSYTTTRFNGETHYSTPKNMREHGVRSVEATCEDCKHEAVANLDHLPDHLYVRDIALRLRCSACGSKKITDGNRQRLETRAVHIQVRPDPLAK
jgi:hypothetical protein